MAYMRNRNKKDNEICFWTFSSPATKSVHSPSAADMP